MEQGKTEQHLRATGTGQTLANSEKLLILNRMLDLKLNVKKQMRAHRS